MSEPLDPHGGRPAEPSPPPAESASPIPGAGPDYAQLHREHPELLARAASRTREQPRWRTLVAFGFLFLIALAGAAGSADVAFSVAWVGSGLGGREVVLTGVTSIVRNSAATVVSPSALAGHSVTVVGGTRDGVYHLWPGQSGFASERGWSFLFFDWVPLVILLLFLLALRVIVKAFVATARGQEV